MVPVNVPLLQAVRAGRKQEMLRLRHESSKTEDQSPAKGQKTSEDDSPGSK
jgi:hypothetical protein